MTTPAALTAFGLVCGLKPSPKPSSSELDGAHKISADLFQGLDDVGFGRQTHERHALGWTA